MDRCSSCSTEYAAATRFCPQCGKAAGTAVDPDSQETVVEPVEQIYRAQAHTVSSSQASSQPSSQPSNSSQNSRSTQNTSQLHQSQMGDQRFPPGMLLARRYRIISRLGKGGMGEVFRADDLILGQPVALKFLPPSANTNTNLLTRFYDEVRIARQISHKNVCRVYDVGDIDGQTYLSMEYIDGEDLGSLLRRIGRLPSDKATEFARKLCAGIGAAHAQGVLHRDIKPGNIMIDARGELRVADFGLAGVSENMQGAEIRNGTPAYMAPEQLTGHEVSVQSDIYAIGLVMYEMFTGKLPHQADTVAEITRLRQESVVSNPSTVVADLDGRVERAILRCLEPDPKDRPASAMALAALLPGGDALAAALADGETPSPEAVAAAGTNQGLNPRLAMGALAAFFACLLAFVVISPQLHLINLLPFENPPAVLESKARDIIRSMGYKNAPVDSASGFIVNSAYFNYMRPKAHKAQDPRKEWERIILEPPSALGFWYRQSPRPLLSEDRSAALTLENPPAILPGMVSVLLDPDGKLWRFKAVPPEKELSEATDSPDWGPFFAAAAIDPTQLTSVPPEWTPDVATDSIVAWTGPYNAKPTPDEPLPVRIEASSFHGRPVSFRVFWPWIASNRAQAAPQGWSAIGQTAINLIFLGAAILVARYNWRVGRSDTRSATRVGLACAGMNLLASLINTHHVAGTEEVNLLVQMARESAFTFALFWLIYLALEPWIRRYWPQTMIVWSRLLAGRWQDPMVGRDVLVGILCGLLYGLLVQSATAVVARYYGEPSYTELGLSNLLGAREGFATLTRQLSNGLTVALSLFLAMFVLRILLRKQWLAAVVFVALFAANQVASNPTYFRAVLFTLIYGFLVVIMTRLGFFALVVTLFTLNSTLGMFLTPNFGAWYGTSSLILVTVLVAMTLWAFRTSLAGQSVFGAAARPAAKAA